MIRVLVAAASAVARAGLEAVVSSSPALTVIGAVPNGPPLAAEAASLAPDVVLVDLGARDGDGVVPLASEAERPAVVVLADGFSREWALDAIRAGVRGFLPGDATAGEITAAIESVVAGLLAVHTSFTDMFLPEVTHPSRPGPTAPHERLTPREVEVLEMIAEGVANKTIARRLGISEHTVKFHVGSIFSKLNVSSRAEAVTAGARSGVIML